MLNGDGLRVVLWVSGCSHCCRECQNPVTWDANGGLPFDEEAREELFAMLARDYIAGLTLSGGDPLYSGNRAEVLKLAREVRQAFPAKTIWLYTGFVWEAVEQLELMDYIDVVVDGEFVMEKKDTKLWWRGSSNQRVIDVKATRAAGHVVLHCE